MRQLLGITLEELRVWLEEIGERPFRAKQIFEWLYHRGINDISEITNISASLRENIKETFSYPCLELKKTLSSEDKETVKYLWQLHDGYNIESVLIHGGGRRTVCVSTQVGCGVRCAFCASGRKGFIRNLSTAEIIEQVINIKNQLEDGVSHVVFMGMGEPLENLDAVIPAIRFLTQPEGLNISQRRVTVSTVGVVEGIEKLIDSGLKVNLAFSLHASNQELREKLIPYAKKYKLKDIIAAVDHYSSVTKRDATYEYILIKDYNDGLEHAHELIALVEKRQITINIIPCNPVPGSTLLRPTSNQVRAFVELLKKAGITTTCRYTKGKDIAAACGQLT